MYLHVYFNVDNNILLCVVTSKIGLSKTIQSSVGLAIGIGLFIAGGVAAGLTLCLMLKFFGDKFSKGKVLKSTSVDRKSSRSSGIDRTPSRDNARASDTSIRSLTPTRDRDISDDAPTRESSRASSVDSRYHTPRASDDGRYRSPVIESSRARGVPHTSNVRKHSRVSCDTRTGDKKSSGPSGDDAYYQRPTRKSSRASGVPPRDSTSDHSRNDVKYHGPTKDSSRESADVKFCLLCHTSRRNSNGSNNSDYLHTDCPHTYEKRRSVDQVEYSPSFNYESSKKDAQPRITTVLPEVTKKRKS